MGPAIEQAKASLAQSDIVKRELGRLGQVTAALGPIGDRGPLATLPTAIIGKIMELMDLQDQLYGLLSQRLRS